MPKESSVQVNDQFQPLFPELTEGAIRRVQAARRARIKFFPAELFSDPAWDLLLELYACELGEQRVAVTELSAITGVAGTTSLRWICRLEADGLVIRTDDPLDRASRGSNSRLKESRRCSATSLPSRYEHLFPVSTYGPDLRL